MNACPQVVVEFYGMARRNAGRESLGVGAHTVAQALTEVARTLPTLKFLLADGRLSRHYLASVNAGPFLDDLDVVLRAGDRVLLLSADSGG